ncbi:hypothetical protein [Devosia nitrariae]|uniref:Uncharacterized protein n=1 Tax=Devosia nitrariae TaxID=2071872 RepID=A0ABQ5W8E7_9HYPH|nr:hypothetical protein [Devosia nitrariae]GLQ56357.1 hypothetical protein GCM10010862_36160 [Devosia nitrariae]
MLEILLATHINQIDTFYRPAQRQQMEEAFYRAGPDMAVFGRVARFVVACLLLTPLVSLLADNIR